MSFLSKLFKNVILVKEKLTQSEDRLNEYSLSSFADFPTKDDSTSSVCGDMLRELSLFHATQIEPLKATMNTLLTHKMAAVDEVTGENIYNAAVIAKAKEHHAVFADSVHRYEALLLRAKALAELETKYNTQVQAAVAEHTKQMQAHEASCLQKSEAAKAALQQKRAEEASLELEKQQQLHQNALKIRKLNEDQSVKKIAFVEALLAAIDARIKLYNRLFVHDLTRQPVCPLTPAPGVDRLKRNIKLLKQHCKQPQEYQRAISTLGNLLAQIMNHPEDMQLRSVHGENKSLVSRLLHIGYDTSTETKTETETETETETDAVAAVTDEGLSAGLLSTYVPIGLHCLLSIGFSISNHGAVLSLIQYLRQLKAATRNAGGDHGTATSVLSFGTVVTTSGDDSSASNDGKYNWERIIDDYFADKSKEHMSSSSGNMNAAAGVHSTGIDAIMNRYIDHGWRFDDASSNADSAAALAGDIPQTIPPHVREPLTASNSSYPLHCYQFAFMPEPNPESTNEEDMERWSQWYNTVSAYSECLS